jgi:dTDP-glucose 4,6-dehydratase
MSMKNQTVLVTGAGGFIGSHLAERLVEKGARVRAFLRYTSHPQRGFLEMASPEIRSAIQFVHGDLRDYHAVLEAARGTAIVFHLGALIGIPYSYVHPREVIDTNTIGTANVLMAAREIGVGRVVHTSTSEVYGTARYTPIDEQHPLNAQSPYSASKIAADKIAESLFYSFGLPVTILRPFNTYGPRQSARAVIPTIITQALVGEEIVLGNLESLRDFTYVADTVEGFIAAAESESMVGRTVNLGTATEISVGLLVETIGRLMAKTLRAKVDEKRKRPPDSEVDRLLSNNAEAGRLMNWRPRVSLEEGLKRTIDWIRDHLSLYEVGRYEI